MIKKNKILVLVGALGIALLSTIGCTNTKKVDNNTIQENETEDKYMDYSCSSAGRSSSWFCGRTLCQ